jgi:modification methylase
MKTIHKIFFTDAQKMDDIQTESIDLMVTSPPYPMVEMWDGVFTNQNPKILKALKSSDGATAFELMHQILDRVWDEVRRVLKPGAVACINIGDATRTIHSRFSLFANHTRIQSHMLRLGFSALPCILWRKQTNAPNKFMGSGMLPPGAYVTLEHEYILIFRKGNKKLFTSSEEKQIRRESAYFWEERNQWFSDVWMDLKGTRQELSDNKTRDRNAAFPFELAYRLICMFSVKHDRVLDPFLGIGTSMVAAMAAARNFFGFDIDPSLKSIILSRLENIVEFSNRKIENRLQNHLHFVENRIKEKGPFKHVNQHYGFHVMTSQEKDLMLNSPQSLEKIGETIFKVIYSDNPQEKFIYDKDQNIADKAKANTILLQKQGQRKMSHCQIKLFDN